jgi:thioredoxin-dependent peroxiredoxin
MSWMYRRSLILLFIIAAIPFTVIAEEKTPSPRPAVGDKASDFELNDLAEKPIKLSGIQKEGPVVVLVLRGWPGYQCPLCTRQVGEFIGAAKKFKEAGATVVMVYPGPSDDLDSHAKEFVQGKEFPDNFRFVTDPGYTFTDAWKLRWDANGETAYPSTFVIGKDGKIAFAKVSMTHGGRSSIDEVLRALK